LGEQGWFQRLHADDRSGTRVRLGGLPAGPDLVHQLLDGLERALLPRPPELGDLPAVVRLVLRQVGEQASSTGFSVKWIMLWGLTFLMCQRSIALFGPKKWWAAPSRQP
jgi:hypothetical protein